MRVMDWNIEWMNDWFVGGNRVAFRENYNGIHGDIRNVADLCQRVASVIKTINPDVLTVQEGPSDKREMELFINEFLKDENGAPLFKAFGGFEGRTQKNYNLVKVEGEFKEAELATDELTLKLNESWLSDIDGDLNLEEYEFTRTPVVVEGKFGTSDSQLKILTLHTKSKYVHRQEELWNNPNTRMQFITEAMKNRRRISSEAMRIRKYLDGLIENNRQELIVVTGDFNDGPGHDYFERYYLTHNVTDIILGSTFQPELLFKHSFINRVPKEKRYTAIFDDFIDEIPSRLLLLDHIVVSPVLSDKIVNSEIAHNAFNAAIDESATSRQKYPSDHRPVFVDLA